MIAPLCPCPVHGWDFLSSCQECPRHPIQRVLDRHKNACMELRIEVADRDRKISVMAQKILDAEARIQVLEQDIRTGLRIAHQLTEETQTVEEACADLVRLVRKARDERNEALFKKGTP